LIAPACDVVDDDRPQVILPFVKRRIRLHGPAQWNDGDLDANAR
jgi:hypothetical protein